MTAKEELMLGFSIREGKKKENGAERSDLILVLHRWAVRGSLSCHIGISFSVR